MNLISLIDHSVLKPTSTVQEVKDGAAIALKYQTAAYCIRPSDVPLAAKLLAGSEVKVCTVIGFPHGTTDTNSKAFEAAEAVRNGAHEVDMVINIGWMLSGDLVAVEDDIRQVVNAARGVNDTTCIKVILETAYLSKEQIVKACELSESAGADFVKTSTGFAPEGATVENIALMRATVGDRLGVKASGGIRTLEQVEALVAAGASRVGLSGTAEIFN
ncbi:MAG: deoxyribose-phosphate aldolase [Rhodoluna sp.]|nr:deoxyribose-phosphate aldolase [Rhodoluna sp.]